MEEIAPDLWVPKESYYGMLIPMTIIPSLLVVYLNWLGMKFYVNN